MTAPAKSQTGTAMPSAAACAEAAAWIARLHGEDRTAKVEAGFQRWLVASSDNRAAFEMANEIWLSTDLLPKPPAPTFVRWPRTGLVLTWPRALAAVAVVAFVIAGAWYFREPSLATSVGEQRNLSLEDGTRVSLNTASMIEVHYDSIARRVSLDQGEAFFEVAKRPKWPFIVSVGGTQVTALGTAFLVRRDEQRVSITLMEGKVTVAPASRAADSAPAVPAATPQGTTNDTFTLSPGQRLTFVVHKLPKLDRPALEKVTAWQRGQVILDHTPLSDAVAEMNRYNHVELRIEASEAARAEVTGIFRIGDSKSFAQAVAETYQLKVVDRAGQIVLTGVPSPGGFPSE